ncbi:MAG: cytochrome C [Gammaproteobacteria bacterium HGW-Gammaproteobacteria-11]|nr:MAG: cytochrome C [Gammaproteobacteria bacterium HGW-Gammaproteobacteria-11]
MNRVIAGFLGSVVFAASFSVVAQVTPEDQIKFRKAGYSFMSWNMGKIKAQVIDGSVEYNQDQVAAAANTIAAIANSGMGALYGPGTDQNVGDQVTRVDPALFDNFPDVIELSGNFVRAADNLAEQAATGDQASIRSAFGELGQSCKACHDKYRLD